MDLSGAYSSFFFSLASCCSSISEASDAFLFFDGSLDRPIACCLNGIIDLTTKILSLEPFLEIVRLRIVREFADFLTYLLYVLLFTTMFFLSAFFSIFLIPSNHIRRSFFDQIDHFQFFVLSYHQIVQFENYDKCLLILLKSPA